MMSDWNCLSAVELADLKSDPTAPGADHIKECARCRGLLNSLPRLHVDDAPIVRDRDIRFAARPMHEVDGPRVGHVWLATTSLEGWTWPVVLLARADSEDRIVVAPVVEGWEQATHREILIDEDVLGYRAFVDIMGFGTILREQLVECIGELAEGTAHEVVGEYRSILGIAPALTVQQYRGVEVVSERDPRLVDASLRRNQLHALWRPVDTQIEDDPEALNLDESLGRLIAGEYLDTGEWDKAGIAEAASISTAEVDEILADRLDLSGGRDIDSVVAIVQVLEIEHDSAVAAVRQSLHASPGGEVHGIDSGIGLAARSRPGVSAESVTADLFADSTTIDDGEDARARQISRYLADLQSALDELD